MISPEQIYQKAHNQYGRFLNHFVLEKEFFPYEIKADKKPAQEFAQFSKEIEKLVDNSKEKLGYGYSIEWQKIQKKKLGIQTLPKKIYFNDKDDYLSFLNRIEEFCIFSKNINLIQQQLSGLHGWLARNVWKVIEYANSWPGIIKVCLYFLDNPFPDLYMRELPIEVHSKFIEEHKTILTALLNILLEEEQIDKKQKKFAQRFHLKYAEPSLRFLLLDKHIARQYFSGLSDLSVPLADFSNLKIPIECLIIMENKVNFANIENFLTLPAMNKTMAIFGSGFGVGQLKDVSWLKNKKIYYWGDLDIPGFHILAGLRKYLPGVESILMDKKTLDNFIIYAEPYRIDKWQQPPANLTIAEKEVYQYLQDQQLRLEQEKISHSYCIQQFIKIDGL